MSYTRPSATDADFSVGVAPYVRPSATSADFEFDGVAYTRPSASSSNFDWLRYKRPSASAADFAFESTGISAVGSVTLADLIVECVATHTVPEASIVANGNAVLGDLVASGVAAHGVSVTGLATLGELIPSGTAAHGVSAASDTTLGALLISGVASHPRFSLKGEVRDAGILVNRTVRAYRRDTGELIGEQVTSVGRFDIHAGFESHEHYILPLDLATDAVDYLPPTANRVLSVLAMD